ncbi:MAG: hypothetical protein FWD82_06425 [Defluviitaleaceae bacterium]|nr:hypothetical protein [Defluviitaleaceae bacterium]
MMKILCINGSPKSKNSSSELLINELCKMLGINNEYTTTKTMGVTKQEFLEKFEGVDVAVVVFPLYVDGIPSNLLRLLYESKDELKNINSDVVIYAISNNGFFEGKQNALALDMIKHFCEAAGVKWGQGLGIGAGGMLTVAPIGAGPLKSIGADLKTFSANINESISSDNLFTQPNFPKLLYKLGGHANWKKSAKENGLKIKDLYERR